MSGVSFPTVIGEFVNPQLSPSIQGSALLHVLDGVSHRRLTIQQLVEYLGEYLTSVDELVRSRGTLLLSEVLTAQTLPLERVSVHFLIRFYCDRLQDYPCMAEVLKGLSSLVSYKLVSDEPELIVRTMFQEVQCQSLPQSSRKQVFYIVSTILREYTQEMQTMKSDFVFGVIQMIDGEKDPRNLLVAFQLFVNTIKNLPDYTRFTEELFEIVSCYFPITFKPRPDDPDSITYEELSAALRACFCATAAFAPFCFSFLLDKLTSSVYATKLETLITISHCSRAFGAAAIRPYLNQLWAGVRDEMFTNKDPAVVDQALAAVGELTRILSVDLQSSNGKTPLDELLEFLLIDCTNHISTFSDPNQVVTCGRILAVVAAASIRACDAIMLQTLPVVFKCLQECSEPMRLPLLDLLCALIFATKSVNSLQNTSQSVASPPLEPYATQIYDHLLASLVLGDDNIRSSCVSGLAGLCAAAGPTPVQWLSADAMSSIVARLTMLFISDSSTNVRQKALDSLTLLSRVTTEFVRTQSLPVLLEKLKDESQLTASPSVFSALVAFSGPEGNLFHEIVPQLLRQLKSSLQTEVSEATLDHQLLRSLLRCLASIVTMNVENSLVMEYCGTEFLPNLIAVLSQHTLWSTHILSWDVMEPCARIACVISQHIGSATQEKLINHLTGVFLNGIEAENSGPSFAPITSGSPSQLQLVILYTTIIAQAKPTVDISATVLPSLLPLVTNVSLPSVATATAQCIASMLNKMPEDEKLKDLINLVISELSVDSHPLPNQVHALAWVVKGLLLRNYAKWQELSEKLVAFIGTAVGASAAQAFEIILADDSQVLSKQSAAVIRMLYKQKFFTIVFPLLLSAFKSAKATSSETSSLYLLAISSLLKHVPKAVLLSELPEILPILVQSLTSPSTMLLLSSLDILCMLMGTTPDSIANNVSGLIPPLLNLTITSSSVDIRQKSLKCIADLASLPYHKIFPHKAHILEVTKQCLDDKKRAVRKDATLLVLKTSLLHNHCNVV